jgi:hypothetical protein
MNQKKAKAIRRAAKLAAAQFPAVHNHRAAYKDIVRQVVTEQEVLDESILDKGMRILKRVFGKKAAPKTKLVEKVVHESRQTIMVSGWRFIQQRLKAALRRGEASVDAAGHIGLVHDDTSVLLGGAS